MNSGYFSTRYVPDPDRTAVWKAITEYLSVHIPPDASVLELGAGYCDFINQVSAGKKFAIDVNPDVRRYCASDVTFTCTPADRMRFRRGSIDVVFASNLLEHLTDRVCADVLRRIHTVLRSGGRLILIQPNYFYASREYWDDFTHVKAYSHVSLADLLVSSGYGITVVEKRFLPFSFKSRLPRSYALTRWYLKLPYRPLAKQMLIVAHKP